MNERHDEPIQPAEIPLSSPASHAEGQPGRHHRQPLWIGASLALLVLLAAAVLFVLPLWTASDRPPAAAAVPPPTTPLAAPREDAAQLSARQDIQKLLPQLQEAQQGLEGSGVERWANEDYQRTLALSTEADSQYRQRDFVTALEGYRQSLQQLDDLHERIEPRLQQAITDGLAAVQAGRKDEAQRHFELALAIDAENEAAQEGLARAAVLDDVLAAMAQGRQQEQAGNLQDAREAYTAALALDTGFQAAGEALARVDANIKEQRYQAALDEGFAALHAENDNAARQAFQAALEIRPGDSAANAGLLQATNRIAQRRVTSALEQASTYEEQEQWQDATDAYARLQQTDNSLVAARTGHIRASTRLDLDRQIKQVLADPLRLRSDAALNQAAGLLRDAQAVARPGPRLRQQIIDLERTVQQATVPVTVTLRSDNRTHVSLLRIADLGTLERTEVELRPGRYVATGSRNGYRDVRIEFAVSPGGDVITVEVICREPVRS